MTVNVSEVVSILEDRALELDQPGIVTPRWMALAELFIRKEPLIDKSSGCWVWNAARQTRQSHNYGVVWFPFEKKIHRVHRLYYEFLMGPIPDGLVLDHLCRNPPCCNPAHLEPVSHRENCRRGKSSALKTHCAQGHPWTPENWKVRKNGTKICRICERKRWAH